MKSFTWKIVICLIPVVIAAFAVGRAFWLYGHGQGGFRLGTDLVGGTILVYEVDQDKLQKEVKPEELAEALKRRLDPRDQFNITVRPLGRERIEIILPTGGQHQAEAERAAWEDFIRDAERRWPPKEGTPYDDIPPGKPEILAERIARAYPDESKDAISKFTNTFKQDKRQVTTEEVREFKELIQQQGSLEFRILANQKDDAEAIKLAEAYFAKQRESANPPKDPLSPELQARALRGLPPPPPNGGKPIGAFTYSWVELGRSERKTLHLDNAFNNKGEPNEKNSDLWKMLADKRDKGEMLVYPPGTGLAYFSWKIPDLRPLQAADKDKKYDYFVLTRDPEPGKAVKGDYLTSAEPGNDPFKPQVHFRFNSYGADLFGELTSKNKPDKDGFKRHLAIVLDGRIVSAPVINNVIRDSGMIEGDFSQKDIDRLVRFLRSGALPATLKPTPVSESTMGSTLGADTIKWGTISVGAAFVAILVFMLVYYRFAGLVACIALLANLLLTVGFMVMFGAAFTLPGLAGLVLMLGMAVDANVLIYERLREERDRGASLALAIRNGYDRALPTIIDTHLTGIFTAIVLFIVGNDQLKGFGVSLTAGLVISLFTSLFMTHVMFELWQSKGWLKKLSMMRLFARPNIDFMGIRYYWFAATVILTIFGVTVFLMRGQAALNIDFTGGTLYGGQLAKDHPMRIEELRERLSEERQRALLAVDHVEPLTAEGTRFRIVYKAPVKVGGHEINMETVTLSQPATAELVARLASQLPDLSVVQLFPSFDQAPAGTSHFFLVRTSEKAPELVMASVNRLLGEELKRIVLEPPAIDEKTRTVVLEFADPDLTGGDRHAFASPAQVTMLLQRELHKEGLENLERNLQITKVAPADAEQEGRLWRMQFTYPEGTDVAKLKAALTETQKVFASRPLPERLETFDSQLAEETQGRAVVAIIASWGAILLYLWFRFGNWTFGLAAVLCLIHDLCFTLGIIAFCHYIHEWAPGVARWLLIEDFKIDLTAVAALLTLVGYSVNDTIVVFDRIREVRGKNPLLTPQTINDSVNQTLSRTLLTSFATWLVVFVLYVMGGEGVHLFAFVMVIGVVVGTYSSIYIASPLLLIFGEGAPARGRVQPPQPQPAGAH